jgi:general secretion pathway protein C
MRLKLDARTRRMLRRLPVVNVYSLAELVLIAGLATQGARLVWTILTPVSPLGDWRPAEVSVPGRPYDVLAGFDPFFRLGGAQQGPATVTALQLTLFGIRVDEVSGRGSAIVAGPDGVQRSIGVGEEIQPGVRLKAVAFDHITIDRGGAAEDLFLVQSDAPQAGAPPVAAPGTPLLAGGAPPVAGQPGIRADQIRSEIGFIPRIDGGRVSGLVVRPQGTGNLFRTAGLREGDVVTAIGGRPVTGPQELDRVTADFAGGGNIPITVERGTQTLALAITIAP